MATVTPFRIPVCNADDTIIERVDASRARRIEMAGKRRSLLGMVPNVQIVRFGHSRKRKRGEIARIVLLSVGDDSLEDPILGNPRAYSHLHETETNPENCWTLKRIPTETADLFDTVLTELRAA